MSQNSSRPLSKFNLALALLWLVDVVVTGVGYWVLTTSNATQADFYTSQSADYVKYFSAQSGSNLGATLIGVGITGFIITLAALVVARAIAKSAAVAAPVALDDEPDFDFDEDNEFDADEKAAVQEHAATATGSLNTVTAATVAPTAVASVPAETADAAPVADATTGDEPAGEETDEPKTAR